MFAAEVWISHFYVIPLPASALCFGRPHVVNTSTTIFYTVSFFGPFR